MTLPSQQGLIVCLDAITPFRMGANPMWNVVRRIGLPLRSKAELKRMMIEKSIHDFTSLLSRLFPVDNLRYVPAKTFDIFVKQVNLVHVGVHSINSGTAPVLASKVGELGLEDLKKAPVGEEFMKQFDLIIGVRRRDQVSISPA